MAKQTNGLWLLAVVVASACGGSSGGDTPDGRAADGGNRDATTGTYRFVCLRDTSSPGTDPNGAVVDAIQNYTQANDEYATATTCNFGANADPARSDCTVIAGPKTFCSGDTGYATLGGDQGWVCGELATTIANGHIVTPAGCSASEAVPVDVLICTEANPSSSSCKPCPLTLSGNRSCQVSGL